MENELYHHGILGQKWGVRRYQNYDGTRTAKGRTRYKNTKYTNIDGSVNEAGKILVSNFASKEKAKNDKYYSRYIDKYQKLADKASTDDDRNKYLSMKDSAEASRISVNESIDNMNVNEVLAISIEREAKVKKGVATALGSAAGIALPFLAVKGASAASNYLSEFDPMTGLTKMEEIANSPLGMKAGRYVETAIRGYSDVNAYVFSIYADQALQRISKSGLPQQIGSVAGSIAGTTAGTVIDTVGQSASNAAWLLGRNTNTIANNVNSIGSSAYDTGAKFEQLVVQALNDLQKNN